MLNTYLVCWEIGGWIKTAGSNAIWIELTVVPLAVGCGLLLAWLIVQPRLVARRVGPTAESAARSTAEEVAARIAEPRYRRIGVALDHSPNDSVTLEHAAALARGHGAEMVLIHVVEGVGGQLHGADSRDQERQGDQAYLEQLARSLRASGASVRSVCVSGIRLANSVEPCKTNRSTFWCWEAMATARSATGSSAKRPGQCDTPSKSPFSRFEKAADRRRNLPNKPRPTLLGRIACPRNPIGP